MSNHLLRSHAPISDGNWELLDDEARERLSAALAARKLVDFAGPLGWQYSATNLGRVGRVSDAPCSGGSALQRNFPKSFQVMLTGDPDAFARELSAERFYTAAVAGYEHSLMLWFRKLDGELPTV